MGFRQVLRLTLLAIPAILTADSGLSNPDFNRDAASWTLGTEFRYSPNGGRNGSGGLLLERTEKKYYTIATARLKLDRGKRYRFGGWLRTENVQGPDNGASLALEFYRQLPDGKSQYITGEYLAGLKGTTDWSKIEGDKIVPPNADLCNVSLYLRKGMTGKVWFDDIFVAPENVPPIVYASRSAVDPVHGVTLHFTRDGKALPDHLPVRATFAGQCYQDAIRNNQVHLPLFHGSGDLSVEVFDLSGRTLTRTVIALQPRPESPAPAGSCIIDRYNRTLVDGKPFMPLGIFSAGITLADMKLLKEAGFNTVMPYSTLHLRLDSRQKASPESLLQVLDALHANGLKITPSLKDSYPGTRYAMTSWDGADNCDDIVERFVTRYRQHPALLGYFANDEMPSSRLPELIARRRQLNTLDPHHPVWSVLYQFDELAMYGGSCDIIAVDPYPISPEKQKGSMAVVDHAMLQAKNTGLPVWGVPQIMSFAAYFAKNAKDASGFPSPTRRELNAMFLLMAGHGAKGFILYKYEDLKHWTLPQDNFQKEWPNIVHAVSTLREMEPFIMSTRPVRELTPVSGDGALGRIFLFQNDAGEVRLVFCAIGPGKCSLRLPLAPFGKELRSKFGNTRREDGMIVFRGKDIDCDVIEIIR